MAPNLTHLHLGLAAIMEHDFVVFDCDDDLTFVDQQDDDFDNLYNDRQYQCRMVQCLKHSPDRNVRPIPKYCYSYQCMHSPNLYKYSSAHFVAVVVVVVVAFY